MNENLADEIRKTIESIKDMKTQASGINNYLSILEGLVRADYQKQVDEAYQRGYDKGYADKTNNDEVAKELAKDIYQIGLNDAWDAARKVVFNPDKGGLSASELIVMFGEGSMQRIFRIYTASEAIAKLKAYEEKQKADVYNKGCEGCQWEGNEPDFYPCSICCNSYKNRYERKEE